MTHAADISECKHTTYCLSAFVSQIAFILHVGLYD